MKVFFHSPQKTLRHEGIKTREVNCKYGTKRREGDFFGAARRSRINPTRHATEIRNTIGEFCSVVYTESDR